MALLAALAAYAALAGPAAGQEWLTSATLGLEQAKTENKPLLVYVYFAPPARAGAEERNKSTAQVQSEQLDAEFFRTGAFTRLAPAFVCARVNIVNDERVLERYDMPSKVPSILFLEPRTAAAFAHFDRSPGSATGEQVREVYSGVLEDALRLRELLNKPGGLVGARDELEIGDIYADLGMMKEAGPHYEAAVRAGLDPVNERNLRLILAHAAALAGELDRAIEHLNRALPEITARKHTERDAELWLPQQVACGPLVLEAGNGAHMGVVYKSDTLEEFVDLVLEVEKMVLGYVPPADADARTALEFANTYFYLENAAMALPFYERVAQLGGAGAQGNIDEEELEAAMAGVGICRLWTGDKQGALNDLLAFLKRYRAVRKDLKPGQIDYRPYIMLVVGGLYFDRGEVETARAVLEQVVDEYDEGLDPTAENADELYDDQRRVERQNWANQARDLLGLPEFQ